MPSTWSCRAWRREANDMVYEVLAEAALVLVVYWLRPCPKPAWKRVKGRRKAG